MQIGSRTCSLIWTDVVQNKKRFGRMIRRVRESVTIILNNVFYNPDNQLRKRITALDLCFKRACAPYGSSSLRENGDRYQVQCNYSHIRSRIWLQIRDYINVYQCHSCRIRLDLFYWTLTVEILKNIKYLSPTGSFELPETKWQLYNGN